MMNLQKQVVLAISLIAFLSVAACRRQSTSTQPNTEVPAPGPERVHPETNTTATATETKFFKGSIGDGLGLQMKLVREGQNLTGSYFYQKVGKKIDVRGAIDKDSNVTLEEFDANGKQTGVFKGVWKQDGNGAIEIAGNWTKPGGEKKSAFSLHEEPIEFTHGVEIVARQIKENNKKSKYEIDIQYPQLTGSVDPNFEKFNQTVRGLMTRKANDFKKDMAESANEPAVEGTTETSSESLGSDINTSYVVALAKDDLISIEFTVSSYSAGAAHPNSYTEVVNFDLRNGKTLKLADLFQPGSKYVQVLSTYCIQDLKKQAKSQGADAVQDEEWIQKGAAPELTNYEHWAITKKGLRITFDPYQVAPYAAGPQQVVVPYSALKEIIKPDGAVGQFVK
ncbi:MAG TPA: DUF3298 and DUF4163 domain-containing protein [Pyrinomonadaceae bacterium]